MLPEGHKIPTTRCSTRFGAPPKRWTGPPVTTEERVPSYFRTPHAGVLRSNHFLTPSLTRCNTFTAGNNNRNNSIIVAPNCDTNNFNNFKPDRINTALCHDTTALTTECLRRGPSASAQPRLPTEQPHTTGAIQMPTAGVHRIRSNRLYKTSFSTTVSALCRFAVTIAVHSTPAHKPDHLHQRSPKSTNIRIETYPISDHRRYQGIPAYHRTTYTNRLRRGVTIPVSAAIISSSIAIADANYYFYGKTTVCPQLPHKGNLCPQLPDFKVTALKSLSN